MILISFFLLGIIAGISLSTLCIVFCIQYKSKADRKIKQIASKFKQKGMILEPESEELEAWIKELPNEMR